MGLALLSIFSNISKVKAIDFCYPCEIGHGLGLLLGSKRVNIVNFLLWPMFGVYHHPHTNMLTKLARIIDG